MNEDTNKIMWKFLAEPVAPTELTTLVLKRIHCPRIHQKETLPALGFFTRGGSSTPYIPGIVSPSIQFDCWGDTPIVARQVYRALYDVLQGIQNQTVAVGGSNYLIMSAIEEVQGQDLADEIPGYFRVLALFSIMIRAE